MKSGAILTVQTAYFTRLRLGEGAGLTWQAINLEEQYLTVRRSLRYNNSRHKTEIGPTKRKKVRVVDFCDTLAEILRKAKRERHKNRFQYGELYQRNYYKEVREKNRIDYHFHTLRHTYTSNLLSNGAAPEDVLVSADKGKNKGNYIYFPTI